MQRALEQNKSACAGIFISHVEHISLRKGARIDFLRVVSLGNGLLFLRGMQYIKN